MWFNQILQKISAKYKKQGKVSNWLAETSWIENWVNQMVKRDKYFFYKRRLITEETISFNNPIDYIIELSREIVKNLGLPSKNIVGTFSGVSSAGKVEHRSGEPYFIEISNEWKDDRIAIAAIIAHEMAHVWMDEQGFREADVQMNEKLTDLTAVLLGLGVLLMNGLKAEKTVAQWSTEICGTRTDHRKQLSIKNYITDVEMGYALSVFAAHKNIDCSELKKKMNTTAAVAFNRGYYMEFVRRQDEIQSSRQVESWIVLCSGCFQKLRVPSHAKNIEMTCPLCSRKTKYR